MPPTMHHHGVSRRDLLKLAGLAAAGVSLERGISLSAFAAEAKPTTTADLLPLNHFPRMVQEFFVERLREVQRHGDERRAALRSKADAEEYVRDVRAKIQQCFGPWPEKTPLNPRITGVVERDTYKIEK